ncbi:hypothetical protein ABG067_005165 [Albugo candida]|uniref:non-specific serine/threonine protein kinase n=1 Tax=Albugo candida TaxID=65357 RepID=A0A024FUW5_9STRA|nr:unnamed protein product [Albugo candida]|eukprot:CCI10938.1 unnamed protein product [Albugo candida]
MVPNRDALCEDNQERVIVKVSDNAFASDNRTLCVGPQNFKKILFLGKGSHGRVYSVKSVGLGIEKLYAMKVVCKDEGKERLNQIAMEQSVLNEAKHPCIMSLNYAFQTDKYHYLIMPYCAGGSFLQLLRHQRNHRLEESQARFYAAEVFVALEYLHLLGILVRDLKPENILLHESGHLMLSDFDLATRIHANPNVIHNQKRPSWFATRKDYRRDSISPGASAERKKRRPLHRRRMSQCEYPFLDTETHFETANWQEYSVVGTLDYIAPEVISDETYTSSIDWWAFGILLYEMLYSTTPFKGSTKAETIENLLDLSKELTFPEEIPVSAEAKDLLQRLLTKNSDIRLKSPQHIRQHSFFSTIQWPLIRHTKPPLKPIFEQAGDAKLDELTKYDHEVL